MPSNKPRADRAVLAGILSWILPGAGHFYLGHRGFAAVFLVAISTPYAVGLAIGGIKNSVNPWSNRWLFMAELGTGGYTTAALLANRTMSELPADVVSQVIAKNGRWYQSLSPTQRERYQAALVKYVSFFPESDLAQIYLATAGLLNILCIIDAIARAATGGLPTFRPHTETEADGGG